MDDTEIKDAFARLADRQDCPRCGHHGFDIEWVVVNEPTFALSGTHILTGANEIPVIKCRGCGAQVKGNVVARAAG